MDQLRLVVEGVNDCMVEIVRALGGAKKVGGILWPEKAAEQAHRLLLDCLNPDRPAHLTPEQMVLLLKLSRQAGFHNAKHWLDEETGYTPSEPMEPEDEWAKLQRAYVDSVSLQAKIAERMERLMPPQMLRVAK